MTEITLYQKDFGRSYVQDRFKNSFDAMVAVCKEMDGNYSEKPSFISGEPHGNSCKMQNGVELLGWKDTNRVDILENNRDIIINPEDISISEYRNDDELSLRWGADWVFGQQEGVHGHLNISKKRGLMSISISEFKNHTDSPFFTVYDKHNMR